jgi:hypothetical protein
MRNTTLPCFSGFYAPLERGPRLRKCERRIDVDAKPIGVGDAGEFDELLPIRRDDEVRRLDAVLRALLIGLD